MRVYAGVLGKIIGVYLGRPFEQWSHERIVRELGEIHHYVHERLGKPLIVTDDDITGTFTFVRALADHGSDAERLTPADIGHTWLNYILPHRTILWWGGIGISTEHTAWHHLRSGVPAPRSGSIALNGTTVAEQIGAQIFIEGWGLLCPGDATLAASLAARAASVSHDGEAVHGAQMIAAMVALAFNGPPIDELLDGALAHIPSRCLLARMIADVRTWHAKDDDWHKTLARIQKKYGYDVYPGGCHVIPNHALVILALLYSGGDFHRGMMIVNTAGYDTDCNAANVGCILAVRGGLPALAGGPDWRGPVADRLYLPTADGGRCISDALREADLLVAQAHRLRGLPFAAPKNGARFHFSQPGSVQGFMADSTAAPTEIIPATGRLHLHAPQATNAEYAARVLTATFAPLDTFKSSATTSYQLIACPTLHTGHIVTARVISPSGNSVSLHSQLVLVTLDASGQPRLLRSRPRVLSPGRSVILEWTIPSTHRQPILSIGVEFHAAAAVSLELDWLTWTGAPRTQLLPLAHDEHAPRTWVDACTGIRRNGDTLLVHQEDGLGFFAQGTREWADYIVEADLKPRLAQTWGLAVRWQGLTRHLTVRFDGRRARLIATVDQKIKLLATTRCPWPLNQSRHLHLAIHNDTCRVLLDGKILLTGRAIPEPLDGGAVALIVSVGSLECTSLTIA